MFRSNALEAQSNKLDGDVIIAQPVTSSLLTACLLTAVVVTILFLSISSFNRKETVAGFLQPDLGLSRISAPRNGVVSAVYVDSGDEVKKGEPLMLLKAQDYLLEGTSLSSMVSSNLTTQINLLEKRKAQTKSRSASQKSELEQRIKFHNAQIGGTEEQLNLLEKRLDISKQRLQNMRSLIQSGSLAVDEVRKQQELVLNVRQQLAELEVSKQAHHSQLEQLSGELERLPGKTAQELTLLGAELAQLRQQRLEANFRKEVLITAPMNGVVTNLITTTGEGIRQSESLLTVIPKDAKLKAILLVPTRAYGFIEPGQSIKVRFEAFPYQHFGSFDGQISKTSQSIMLPNEASMPVAIQEPVYRVEAELAAQKINADGEPMPLKAGMLLSSDVLLERRSLLAWLFEPLLSLE